MVDVYFPERINDSRWLIERSPPDRCVSHLMKRLQAQLMLRRGEPARRTLTLISWLSRGTARALPEFRKALAQLTGSDRLATRQEVREAYLIGFMITKATPLEELRVGDFILTLDGSTLRKPKRLNEAIKALSTGRRKTIAFTRWRQGKVVKIALRRKRFRFSGDLRVKLLTAD